MFRTMMDDALRFLARWWTIENQRNVPGAITTVLSFRKNAWARLVRRDDIDRPAFDKENIYETYYAYMSCTCMSCRVHSTS